MKVVIMLWFLMSMKSVVRFLAAYDRVMVLAFVFLQWHYRVDLFGGLAVAAVVLLIHIWHRRDSAQNRSKLRSVLILNL